MVMCVTNKIDWVTKIDDMQNLLLCNDLPQLRQNTQQAHSIYMTQRDKAVLYGVFIRWASLQYHFGQGLCDQ